MVRRRIAPLLVSKDESNKIHEACVDEAIVTCERYADRIVVLEIALAREKKYSELYDLQRKERANRIAELEQEVMTLRRNSTQSCGCQWEAGDSPCGLHGEEST